MDSTFSKFVYEPLISLGFNYYYNKAKDSLLNVLNNTDSGDIRRLNVTNPYEYIIDNYENDILHTVNSHFKWNDQNIKTNIKREFFKIWELLIDLDYKPKTMNYLLVGESFLKYDPIVALRNKQKGDTFQNDMKEWTSPESIMKKYKPANLIVANFDKSKWRDYKYQEQEFLSIFLGEIIVIFELLENGGCAIIKIFDCYTNLTLKLIQLLADHFEHIDIKKPLMSIPSKSERYLVCKHFKKPKKRVNLLDTYNKIVVNERNGFFWNDCNLQIELSLQKKIIQMNKLLAIQQFNHINKIIKYNEEGNFFGDTYHEYRNQQIEKTTEWIKNYFLLSLG